MASKMLGRPRWALLSFVVAIGCATPALDADTSRPAARVSAQPTVAYGLTKPNWGTGLPVPSAPADACPREKETLESALGIKAAEACGSLRELRALQGGDGTGIGNGDRPVDPKSYAPFCYRLGHTILVAEYEKTGTQCTRLVGLSLAAMR
jgi:hypothetical protein